MESLIFQYDLLNCSIMIFTDQPPLPEIFLTSINKILLNCFSRIRIHPQVLRISYSCSRGTMFTFSILKTTQSVNISYVADEYMFDKLADEDYLATRLFSDFVDSQLCSYIIENP